jgi:transcriptional regulator with XRE-family HTH domain
MTLDIHSLRDQLQVTLQQLGNFLGVSKSRVHNFESGHSNESGEAAAKLMLLSKLIRQAEKKDVRNTWVDDESLKLKAEAWLSKQRTKTVIKAKELDYELQDMKKKYEASIHALDILTRVDADAECTPELKEWIKYTAPTIVNSALKNSPEKQARIQLRRDELMGIQG